MQRSGICVSHMTPSLSESVNLNGGEEVKGKPVLLAF